MEYTEEQWVATQKPRREPVEYPRTTIRECLEEEEREEAPSESSSPSMQGFEKPQYESVLRLASEFFNGFLNTTPKMNLKETESAASEPSSPYVCESDVTAVVSGVESRHNGMVLCLSSEFFNAFLNSGMEQAKLKRVEFPDKDPEEWKEVVKFFEPVYSVSAGKLTKDNIKMLIPWFDLLGMKHMLKAAEKWMLRKCSLPPGTEHILLSRAKPGHKHPLSIGSGDKQEVEFWKSEVEELCNTFYISVLHQFENLKKDRRHILLSVIADSPDFFTMDSVSTLVSALTCANIDQETKEQVWMSLKVYISPSAASNDNASVLANPFLPHLILKGMELKTLKAHKEHRARPYLRLSS